jgi:hypothetical protein
MLFKMNVAPALRGLPAGLPRVVPVDHKLFPNGLRTSSQHPPIESQLHPFEEFPRNITGPTAWTREHMIQHPEQWIHRWMEPELAELLQAVDTFIASGVPLTSISKVI